MVLLKPQAEFSKVVFMKMLLYTRLRLAQSGIMLDTMEELYFVGKPGDQSVSFTAPDSLGHQKYVVLLQ